MTGSHVKLGTLGTIVNIGMMDSPWIEILRQIEPRLKQMDRSVICGIKEIQEIHSRELDRSRSI